MLLSGYCPRNGEGGIAFLETLAFSRDFFSFYISFLLLCQLFAFFSENLESLFYFICMHFYKHLIVALILLCSFSFAQEKSLNGSIPVAKTPVDSAAYYQKMYEYNLEKYHTDVFVKDVMFWTYIGGMIASGCISLPVALGAGVRGGKISTMEKVGIIAPLAIMGTAGLGYITFEIATLVRRSKYEKYYQKWKDYQIVPFVNPVNGGVGGLLSLNF